jgi:hypothetical protein
MFGLDIPYKIAACCGVAVVIYGVGVWHGTSRANERAERVKTQIESQLKARNDTHLEYVKTLEEQLTEALDHAQIIPATPCLDVDGVRVLNTIR